MIFSLFISLFKLFYLLPYSFFLLFSFFSYEINLIYNFIYFKSSLLQSIFSSPTSSTSSSSSSSPIASLFINPTPPNTTPNTPTTDNNNSSSISNINHIHSSYLNDFIQELCFRANLLCSIYKVYTKDGYEITLHRCSLKSNSLNNLPPVLLVHGLMQDSESFLCGGTNSIVYHLVQAGYDVWIGNNRGTKYSTNHVKYSRNDKIYWDYSIDDLAAYDVPTMIDYILQQTKYNKLAYIGFSQGSTQGFASFTYNNNLNSKISLFIALAPALKSTGLSSIYLQNILHFFPNLIFSIFGYHEMLPCCYDFQKIFSKSFFAKIVSYSMKFLFKWNCQNISHHNRIEFFQSCYSTCSVKCVSQWFQIVAYGSLIKYQHSLEQIKERKERKERKEDNKILLDQENHEITNLKEYQFNSITCPIAIFYGSSDTLIINNIHEVFHLIQKESIVHIHCEETYEHLDLIWADNASTNIFPQIIKQLQKYHN